VNDIPDKADRPIERVGVLGLGQMGGPMAANLVKRGFKVAAYDPKRDALTAAADRGATACATAAEVGRQAEVSLVIPFDYDEVKQAVLGDDGLVEGLVDPALVVVMSTIGPDSAREMGRLLRERGHRMVDAPVSGGAAGAEAGTLTVIAGGSDKDLERCRPPFEAFSANIFHVGQEVGAGQAAKLVNQLLVVAHLVATVEALSLGTRSGIDPRQIHDIISTSVGNSRVFQTRAPVILDRSFKTGGAVKILVKDARLVMQQAASAGAPLPLAATAGQMFEVARGLGLADEDDAALAKAYELLMGGEITP
jgi:L-threonate 2-dehydrogenase